MKTKPVVKEGPMNPSVILLIKLGGIAVHYDELTENPKFKEWSLDDTAAFDMVAIQTLFDDEVKQWVKDMGPLLPLKRSARK